MTTALDIIGITETWMRPYDRFLLPLNYEAATLDPKGTWTRGYGGVSLAYKTGIAMETELKMNEGQAQVIVARTCNLWIAACHFPPSCTL
eukprot:IDg9460t1